MSSTRLSFNCKVLQAATGVLLFASAFGLEPSSSAGRLGHTQLDTSTFDSRVRHASHRKLQQLPSGFVDDGLHPVIAENQQTLFFIENGQTTVNVIIDGSPSHTHQTGGSLTGFSWVDETGATVGDTSILIYSGFAVGDHNVTFTIFDNFGQSMSIPFSFIVANLNDVPGSLVRLYKGGGATPVTITDAAIYGYVTPFTKSFNVPADRVPQRYSNYIIRIEGNVDFPAAGAKISLANVLPEDSPWVQVDGVDYDLTAAPVVPAGRHFVEFRCYLTTRKLVGLRVANKMVQNPRVDLSATPPIIFFFPGGIEVKVGQTAELRGFLVKSSSIVVDNNPVSIMPESINSDAYRTFVWPTVSVAEGYVDVYVMAGTMKSNVLSVHYNLAIVDPSFGGPFSDNVKFVQKRYQVAPWQDQAWATRMVFCHGSIFAAVRRTDLPGEIWRLEVDDGYNIKKKTLIASVPLPMNVILGLACDPRDDDATFKLYFSHSKVPASGVIPSPDNIPGYESAVSYIMPNKKGLPKAIVPVIRNLGVSNHDHAAFAIDFLHDGRMLLSQGSNTNAGMLSDKMGFLEDGPTVGQVMVADIRNSKYNGKLTYQFLPDAPLNLRDNATAVTDQRYTSWAKCTNKFIKPYIYGVRCAYSMIVDFEGRLSVAINGPNGPWGRRMIGLDPVTKEPISDTDDLALGPNSKDGIFFDVAEGMYLGHPNLALCRAGHGPSCTYIDIENPPASPPAGSNYRKANKVTLPGTTGFLQYNSHAFNGVYHKQWFAANYRRPSFRYNPYTQFMQQDTSSSGTYPKTMGIDFNQGPGGVHIVATYDNNEQNTNQTSYYTFNIPYDDLLSTSGNVALYDIVPNKAAKTQANKNTFVIGGENFDSIPSGSSLTVSFGGVSATGVKVVGKHWIQGYIPSNPAGGCPTQIDVQYGNTTLSMPDYFCYLEDLPPVKAPPLVR